MTENSKYRVTYRGFREYADTGKHLTNVHVIMECDVVAINAINAVGLACIAFGEEAQRSGDWKVKMLRSPQELEFVGTQPERSTIVTMTKMGA